jgi:hypothetical protein
VGPKQLLIYSYLAVDWCVIEQELNNNNNNNNNRIKSKPCTSNNRGNCNHLQTINKIPEQHTGKHDIKELQTTAILNTAHVLRVVKVKVTLEQAMKAQRGSRGIALLFL